MQPEPADDTTRAYLTLDDTEALVCPTCALLEPHITDAPPFTDNAPHACDWCGAPL